MDQQDQNINVGLKGQNITHHPDQNLTSSGAIPKTQKRAKFTRINVDITHYLFNRVSSCKLAIKVKKKGVSWPEWRGHWWKKHNFQTLLANIRENVGASMTLKEQEAGGREEIYGWLDAEEAPLSQLDRLMAEEISDEIIWTSMDPDSIMEL